MDETISLFDRVVSQLGKEWNPKELKNTIDDPPQWDHVLLQAFFSNLGRKLGFEVACEKYRKWDVAWINSETDSYVQIEIELHSSASVEKAFSKICETSDKVNRQLKEEKHMVDFSGILVIKDFLDRQNEQYKDFIFDYMLNPEEESRKISYPQDKALDILIIDVDKRMYKRAKVGPGRKYGKVISNTF